MTPEEVPDSDELPETVTHAFFSAVFDLNIEVMDRYMGKFPDIIEPHLTTVMKVGIAFESAQVMEWCWHNGPIHLWQVREKVIKWKSIEGLRWLAKHNSNGVTDFTIIMEEFSSDDFTEGMELCMEYGAYPTIETLKNWIAFSNKRLLKLNLDSGVLKPWDVLYYAIMYRSGVVLEWCPLYTDEIQLDSIMFADSSKYSEGVEILTERRINK